MDNVKISAVLITKEKEYPAIVLERIEQGFFDEILIVTECPSIYHRYLAAAQAKNEIIYVQDDDCMANYQVLFRRYNGLITNAMPIPFQKKYEKTGCTLVGWGCYFHKSRLDVFKPYVEKYGEQDIHLVREADRIFTFLNQPFNIVTMPHEDLFQDGSRMGDNPDHYTMAAQAIEKCKKLLPLREQ